MHKEKLMPFNKFYFHYNNANIKRANLKSMISDCIACLLACALSDIVAYLVHILACLVLLSASHLRYSTGFLNKCHIGIVNIFHFLFCHIVHVWRWFPSLHMKLNDDLHYIDKYLSLIWLMMYWRKLYSMH